MMEGILQRSFETFVFCSWPIPIPLAKGRGELVYQRNRGAVLICAVRPFTAFSFILSSGSQPFLSWRFRSRTPGPPPFSSMNSTPATSKAALILAPHDGPPTITD